MAVIGIITLTGTIEPAFIELFDKEELQLETLPDIETAKKRAPELSGLIIVDEKQTEIGESCGLITQIREHKELLIWVCGTNISIVNRLIYLQLGVDGNIDLSEAQECFLIVRNALLRRNIPIKASQPVEKSEYLSPNFEMIPRNQSVLVNGNQEIELTRLEYRILDILSQQPKQTLNYEELYKHLWGTISNDRDGKPRLANIVFHLRGKLEKNPLNPRLIKTVRSKGYMFVPPEVKS